MEIEFVNHSSVICREDNFALIMDPWLEGDVFQNGWRHIAESSFRYEDFKEITHIWFSHEHPDHFFPPNLKKIPEEARKQITVLYQKTGDKKVVGFCTKLGFKKVIELPPGKWLNLSPDVSVICDSLWGDSWLGVRTRDCSLLNTNDCFIYDNKTAGLIKKHFSNIDVLLTQFSYAQYEGNKLESDKRKKAAEKKLAHVSVQIQNFRPKFFLPFASFVWFCHEENYYCNDNINTIWKVEEQYRNSAVIPVIMYPGDKWRINEKHDNTLPLNKWKEKYKLINEANVNRTNPVSKEELLKNGNLFLQKLNAGGYSKMIKNDCCLICHLYDINSFIKITKRDVVEMKSSGEFNCLISSETLNYCFEHDWGFNTTHVNARVQFLSETAFNNFMQFEQASVFMNQNIKPLSLFNSFKSKFKAFLRSVFRG